MIDKYDNNIFYQVVTQDQSITKFEQNSMKSIIKTFKKWMKIEYYKNMNKFDHIYVIDKHVTDIFTY